MCRFRSKGGRLGSWGPQLGGPPTLRVSEARGAASSTKDSSGGFSHVDTSGGLGVRAGRVYNYFKDQDLHKLFRHITRLILVG